MNVLVLHGPNLNLLGVREPKIYGRGTLEGVNALLRAEARRMNLKIKCFQRNGEGQLIDLIHKHRGWADGILINPAAYTHYSYAIHDALKAVGLPAVEVHLSDIARREPWRRVSVTRAACRAQISGLGPRGYVEGLRRLVKLIA